MAIDLASKAYVNDQLAYFKRSLKTDILELRRAKTVLHSTLVHRNEAIAMLSKNRNQIDALRNAIVHSTQNLRQASKRDIRVGCVIKLDEQQGGEKLACQVSLYPEPQPAIARSEIIDPAVSFPRVFAMKPSVTQQPHVPSSLADAVLQMTTQHPHVSASLADAGVQIATQHPQVYSMKPSYTVSLEPFQMTIQYPEVFSMRPTVDSMDTQIHCQFDFTVGSVMVHYPRLFNMKPIQTDPLLEVALASNPSS